METEKKAKPQNEVKSEDPVLSNGLETGSGEATNEETIPSNKSETASGAVTQDGQDGQETLEKQNTQETKNTEDAPPAPDDKMAVLLKRIEQLESMVKAKSSEQSTSSVLEPLKKPTEDLKSMYIDMKKNDEGRYDKENTKRPTDGEKWEMTNPPYILTTYWAKGANADKGTREKTMLEIRSEPLRKLMRDTMEKMITHTGAGVWKKVPVTIETVNVIVSHCFDDLKAATEISEKDKESKTPEEKDAIEVLKRLLDDLECIEPDAVCAKRSVNNEQAVTWEKTWSLYPPGSEVVGWLFQESSQIFIVHTHGPRDDAFIITCWAYDWDGTKLVRFYYEFPIQKFVGTKSVTEMPCYPLRFHKDEAELRQQLVGRGKRFRDFCIVPQPTPLYKATSFFTLPRVMPEEINKDLAWMLMKDSSGALIEIKSNKDDLDIIIDPALCRMYAMGSYQRLGDMKTKPVKVCDCILCDLNGLRKPFENSFKAGSPEPGEHDRIYSLLPPRLHGYLPGHKKWGQVLVDSVNVWNDETPLVAWNELSIAKKDKENIQAMVSAYFAREANGDQYFANIQDPIPGKGEGIVILLHGIPGVGKTMTAETLARSLGRRLLRIDASDFEHHNASQVSDVFKRYFHMASSWGALLLLDEADVFLQTRQRVELAQNALVSVLLRELEYFQGVLIMTTNRIVSVDFAVQSRIHYAVKFLKLREDAIEKIWQNYRRQLTDHNCDKEERAEIDRWFKYSKTSLVNSKFTGRDIRNVFMCAQLLGYPKITCENLDKAVKSTTSFRQDLEKTNQKTVNQNAVVEE